MCSLSEEGESMKTGKTAVVIGSMLLAGCLMFGCEAEKPAVQYPNDAAGAPAEAESADDAAITAKWTLVEFTTQSGTTKYEELSEEDQKAAPAFRTEDGKTCVFSLDGKDHNGTITEKDGTFVITYDDTDKTMIATIKGNEMTIVNDEGTLTFIFRTE